MFMRLFVSLTLMLSISCAKVGTSLSQPNLSMSNQNQKIEKKYDKVVSLEIEDNLNNTLSMGIKKFYELFYLKDKKEYKKFVEENTCLNKVIYKKFLGKDTKENCVPLKVIKEKDVDIYRKLIEAYMSAKYFINNIKSIFQEKGIKLNVKVKIEKNDDKNIYGKQQVSYSGEKKEEIKWAKFIVPYQVEENKIYYDFLFGGVDKKWKKC